MKNHEFENEPELEPPFEVAEEFLDRDEDEEEKIVLKVDLLRRAILMEAAG